MKKQYESPKIVNVHIMSRKAYLLTESQENKKDIEKYEDGGEI